VIQADSLSRSYGDRWAIKDVSFEARPGEILGFLGPNGAGKTTTMRVLAGFLAPTSGRASVAGFDVVEKPLEAKRRLGYLPEAIPLYEDFTTREYLQFVARLKGVDRRKVDDAVDQAMTLCATTDVADRLVRNLSRGYRQRVGLAHAIVHDPPVLILDEPTSAMDPRQIVEIRNVIRGLRGTHTIILSTHILPEVSQTCDRVVIINKGRVVAEDTPHNLTARLRGSETLYIQVDADGADASGALQRVPGVTRVAEADRREKAVGYEVQSESGRDVRRDLARAVVSGGWGLLELRPMHLSLEEIFLSLTTDEAAGGLETPEELPPAGKEAAHA